MIARDIYLGGAHAAAFLLSGHAAEMDEAFDQAVLQRNLGKRHFMAYLEGVVQRPPMEAISSAAPAITREDATRLARWIGVDTPIRVCVQDEDLRRRSKRLTCMPLGNAVPAGCFIPVEGEVYSACPELALLQCSQDAADVETIVLASLLFSIFGSGGAGGALIPRRAWTTREMVQDFLDRCRRGSDQAAKGANRLQRLMRHAVEHAASPRELELALILGLPLHMDGLGLGLPQVNYPVAIPGSNTPRYGDLVWPSRKVCVEYDGADAHSTPEQLCDDAVRCNDLVSAGMRVFKVTGQLLDSPALFAQTASQIAKGLGAAAYKRSRPAIDGQRWLGLQREIRSAFEKYGFGPDPANGSIQTPATG